MKKWLLVISIVLVLVVLLLYFLIPAQTNISRTIGVKANGNAVYRKLLNDQSWMEWWPKNTAQQSVKNLNYKDALYRLDQKLFNAFAIGIEAKDAKLNSELNLIPIERDSLTLVWNVKMDNPDGPLNKIKNYVQSKKLGEQMNELLHHLKTYLEDQRNLYGSIITQTKVKDTVLVATRISTDHYPTTDEIYAMVDKLKAYIKQNGAQENDFPMLHIDSANGKYNTMVGIPTDTLVNGNNADIELKRMVLGNILMTEVRGGVYTTRNALRQMEHYVYDYKRTSPAIPYESLITDRRKERDTAKWITRIYYPVF